MRRKSRNGAIAIAFVIAAAVIIALLTVADQTGSPLAAIKAGIGADAHYLDPIEMVCHYYPLEAERVRARSDIQEALRLRWAACWIEGTEMAGWAQNWGQYGPHADSPHKWSALLRRHAQEARMTRAEQALWLDARHSETAECLVLSAGVEYAMQHDGGPIFR